MRTLGKMLGRAEVDRRDGEMTRMGMYGVKDTENKYKGEEKMFGDGPRSRTQLSVCEVTGFRGRGSW